MTNRIEVTNRVATHVFFGASHTAPLELCNWESIALLDDTGDADDLALAGSANRSVPLDSSTL